MIIRVLTLFFCTAGVALAGPTRDEFAYEAQISLKEPASLYRVPLTANVYQRVTRADLGDIRVFNAAGEIVPHGLNRPTVDPKRNIVNLPLFPLELGSNDSRDDVSLHVEVGKDGTIVNVRSTTHSGPKRTAYLVDTTKIEKALSALNFQWRAEQTNGGVYHVDIEASDDLKNWRRVTQGVLARLVHNGQVLERDRAEFAAQRAKYLRIMPVTPAAGLTISAVRGEFSTTSDPQRNWLGLAAQPSEKPNEQRFFLNAQMAADRARLNLTENSVARVTILYRDKDGDAWQYAGQRTVYRLQAANTDIRDVEIRFGRGIVARQWMIRQTTSSGAGLSQITGLELGWQPHDLIFVARGAAPFRLAYGRYGLAPVDDGIDELLRQSKRGDAQNLKIGDAVLENPEVLSGERALQRSWTAGWKTWLLWAILLLGVVMLAYLALHVGKQVGREEK